MKTKKQSQPLDLTKVPPAQHRAILAAYRRGDVFALVDSLPTAGQLRFVRRNVSALKRRRIYEAALIRAYTLGCYDESGSQLRNLFRQADRNVLLALGRPLPEGETITLYRGVSNARFGNWGVSWADTLGHACVYTYSRLVDGGEDQWFSPSPDYAIHRAAVPRSRILWCGFFGGCPDVREYVALPETFETLAIQDAEVRENAQATCRAYYEHVLRARAERMRQLREAKR